jgi:hypothetical protein
MVCKLNKYLYGLKQPPGLGTVALPTSCVHNALSKPSRTRPCSSSIAAQTLRTSSSTSMILCSPPPPLGSCLQQEFATKDLGALHHFLGITIERCFQGMFLHQRQYTVDLLERAGMVECKLYATPVDTQGKVSAAPPPRSPIRPATGALSGHSSTYLHQARHRLRRPAGVPPHARPSGAAPHRNEEDPVVLAWHP